MKKLLLGDCKDKLKEIGENTVDAIVCDPPYELGFMGKKWDNTGIAYNVEMWKDCLRVLKPGGHLLAFSGTRTYHRMTCAIEDAGFEIRDMIEWVHAQGFPKSNNIGKALDKKKGNKREWIGESPFKASEEAEQRTQGKSQTGRTTHPDITKGSTAFEGYGTNVKPSHEPICLARKPITEKTIAENCEKWGTGGLNIDGCRIGIETEIHTNGKRTMYGGNSLYKSKTHITKTEIRNYGRFPANIITDGSDEVKECFPDTKTSGPHSGDGKKLDTQNMGWGFKRMTCNIPADEGNLSRCFKTIKYCPKSSKWERNISDIKNHHPTLKPILLMKYLCNLVKTPFGGTVLDPFMGSGTTGMAAILNGQGFIGIEKESDYMEIAKNRIEYAETHKEEIMERLDKIDKKTIKTIKKEKVVKVKETRKNKVLNEVKIVEDTLYDYIKKVD